MRIVVVDDEQILLHGLTDTLREVAPTAEVCGFTKPTEALAFAAERGCEIAFLDIRMRGMTGIELAKSLKEILPKLNVIFVTGYSDYAAEAFTLRASGYLMKPVTADGVRRELENLRNPLPEPQDERLTVQTFGNFEVYRNGKPVEFLRSKSKEILAFLIDKRGTGVTMNEIADILWEDGQSEPSRLAQLRVYISDLKKSLAAVGAEDILLKQRNRLLIDKTKVNCDLYEFINGNPAAINSYSGQYMFSYSWAEFTAAYLELHS